MPTCVLNVGLDDSSHFCFLCLAHRHSFKAGFRRSTRSSMTMPVHILLPIRETELAPSPISEGELTYVRWCIHSSVPRASCGWDRYPVGCLSLARSCNAVFHASHCPIISQQTAGTPLQVTGRPHHSSMSWAHTGRLTTEAFGHAVSSMIQLWLKRTLSARNTSLYEGLSGWVQTF